MKQIIILSAISALLLSGCSSMMDTDSEMMEYAEDNTLHSAQDSVYSVMGILYKMQTIADRSVLLGEIRGDLTTTTTQANSDLKKLATFDVTTSNRYNNIADYYAVINNCNYYLAHIDSTLQKNGKKLFAGEIAAVHGMRAWTYLQCVTAYGSIPYVTAPVLTEKEAQDEMNKTPSDIQTVCNNLITDLMPYIDTPLPTNLSTYYYIPVRVILGDLCLWAGRYAEAAQYYHDYLTLSSHPRPIGINMKAGWNEKEKTFETAWSSYDVTQQSEVYSMIPMESQNYYGVKSDLTEIFNSTSNNYNYFQVTPSQGIKNISAAQTYCKVYKVSDTETDTLYAPKTGLKRENQAGDLRLYFTYDFHSVNQSVHSRYNSMEQTIDKISSSNIATTRRGIIYLRYAEALNRAGYPQSAFAVLKYGLYKEAIAAHIDSTEIKAAGSLITFNSNDFTSENTMGIHSRGCGNSDANAYYTLPIPGAKDKCVTRQDTVNYQIPLVENLIVTEMALEGSFEGYRYYDLMRVALRRNDVNYLAEPISMRNGTKNEAIYSLLQNKSNWFLPKP
jgi:hypothetical protein